jgi:hypothetical protein
MHETTSEWTAAAAAAGTLHAEHPPDELLTAIQAWLSQRSLLVHPAD